MRLPTIPAPSCPDTVQSVPVLAGLERRDLEGVESPSYTPPSRGRRSRFHRESVPAAPSLATLKVSDSPAGAWIIPGAMTNSDNGRR